MSKHIIMVNVTTQELKLIAGKRGIKSYQNMSREKLLSTLDESEFIFENLSQNELKRIAKMKNLSQNELEQIIKMSNLSQDELEKIAKMRHIKNYKNVSREESLISLLKSKQSIAERRRSKDNNAEIQKTKKIFNDLRNSNYLKELETKNNLTEQEKRDKKHYTLKLKKAEEVFKILKEDLNRLKKHQCHDNDDVDYKGIKQI